MAGHGSSSAPDKGSHPGRSVAPSSWKAPSTGSPASRNQKLSQGRGEVEKT